MERENSQRMIPRRRGNDQKNIHMRRRKHRKHRFLKVLVVDGDRNVEIDRKCGKLGQTVAVG